MEKDWYKPAGLKIWSGPSRELSRSALDKMNDRRLFMTLQNSRTTPKVLKLSRRSRRRWRGKYGGLWSYPQNLIKIWDDRLQKTKNDLNEVLTQG